MSLNVKTAGFMVYGYPNFTKSGFLSHSKNFTEDLNEVNCEGKSYMVTGANSGLGKSVATFLAGRKGTVHMICRDEGRGKQAFQEIQDLTQNKNLHLHICDVSEQKSIQTFVQKFIEEFGKLDVLVNNAGVMLSKPERNSEGLCKVLATNTISGYLLTYLLLPLLRKSEDARVVFVSSGGAFLEKLAIGTDYTLAPYSAEGHYAKTKRHQIDLCKEFSKLYPTIGFYTQHPGWADTTGVVTSMPEFYEMMKDNLRTVEQGADCINWLCVSKIDIEKNNGNFFRDRKEEIKHLPLADTAGNDTDSHKRALWSWLSEITKVGRFDVDLLSIVKELKETVLLSKHSSNLFSSSISSVKGSQIISKFPKSDLSAEQILIVCQMLLDAGHIYDVFAKTCVPYVLFKKDNYYAWGNVPSDAELLELVNDEWVNGILENVENIGKWQLQKESTSAKHVYKVYQRSHPDTELKPTMIHIITEATVEQIMEVIDANMIEKHKLWNSSFDYGQVFRKISKDVNIQYWRYTPSLIDARDFLILRRIKYLEDGRVVIAERSIKHGRFPEVSDSIRCDVPFQIRVLEKLENNKTEIISANLTDIRGWLPASTVNNSNIEVCVDEISKIAKIALKVAEEEKLARNESKKEIVREKKEIATEKKENSSEKKENSSEKKEEI